MDENYKQALKDVKKLINLHKEKYLGTVDSVWLKELSNNNGPWVELEDGIPKLKIHNYFIPRMTRQRDGEITLTDESYENTYVPIRGHQGISIKEAVEKEIINLKNTPKEYEEYEGIEIEYSHLSGGGYVLNEEFSIDKNTSSEIVESFVFHRIHNDFSVRVSGDLFNGYKYIEKEKAIEFIEKNKSSGNVVILLTSY